MVGFQGALTPLVYTHHREPGIPHELARIFRHFAAFALLLSLGLSVFAREILMVITTPEYYAASVVIPLLVPAVLLSGMYIFAPGLGIAKKTGVIATINIGGAVLGVILNFALIPALGIQGAALATLLSSVTIFCTYMVYSQKVYFVPHSWNQLGVAVLVTVGAFLVSAQVNLILWENVIVKFALICIAVGVFVLIGLVETVVVLWAWSRLKRLLVTIKA
jgi:O-antigen/teichoic acid export membrane protein